MTELIIKYPVRTLDDRLLLPADTALSQATLDEMISNNKDESYQKVSILSQDTIRQDLLNALFSSSYRSIFDTKQKVSDLLKFMEKLYTVLPTMESLYYFKQYDNYTYLHILKVFALSTLLSQVLVEDYQDLIRESVAGPIHDFGKICIPLKILKKSTPLTRTERDIIEHHTSAGYVLLSYYLKDSGSFLAKVAKEHHERRDGSGYPLGISVKDQMLEIIMVSDIYDALISTRPYRGTAYDNRTALEELTRMATEGKLGCDVVKALVACNRSTKPHHKECIVSTEERGTPPKDNRYGIINDEEN